MVPGLLVPAASGVIAHHLFGQGRQEVGRPEVDVVVQDLLAHGPHAARASAGCMLTALMMVSLRPSMSCGFISRACLSWSAAPANSLSTSAPSLFVRAVTYSLATRFMPSRRAVTSMTSAARYRATISSMG